MTNVIHDKCEWVSFVMCVGLFCHVCRSLLSCVLVSFVMYVDLYIYDKCEWVSFVMCVGVFCHVCRSLLSCV